MNRPNELIKELQEFNETMYGHELSKTECKELADYISMLEKALDREIYHTPNYKFRQQETLKEIKKCKWCGSEIKENHRGYCSELCREYGDEWEYRKQLAIESEKQ